MSILFGRSVEQRGEVPTPFDQGGAPMISTVPSALRLIPLYAATTGIADDVSITPWHAYRDSGKGYGEKLTKQPAFLDDPDGTGRGFIPWMGQGVMSALLWGFAFGVVRSRETNGTPRVVVWVHPGRVTIDETKALPRFFVDQQMVAPDDAVYVPGPCLPGSILGLSPVALFRLQFSKSLMAQQYAYDAFKAGIMPPGVLRNSERTLPDGMASAVKTQFKAAVAGRDIFVTGKDWDWTALGVPDDDAKFLETIQAGATEIAAIYRVSPEDVGGTTGGSLTYSTVELNQLNRNRRALLPWFRRFEAALTDLMAPMEYVKANMDALVRADLKTRLEAHDIALRIGMETQDEGRSLEDKAPLTPDETAKWQALYGKGEQVDPAAVEARATAELLQKIYLAVGPVITAEEARDIATKGGADLTAPFTPAPKAPPTTEGRTP